MSTQFPEYAPYTPSQTGEEIRRNYAHHQVCRMLARRWHEKPAENVSQQLDEAIELATDLYMRLSAVVDAYNQAGGPGHPADLPVAMALTPREREEIQRSRELILQYLNNDFSLWPPESLVVKEDNSPQLGGERGKKHAEQHHGK